MRALSESEFRLLGACYSVLGVVAAAVFFIVVDEQRLLSLGLFIAFTLYVAIIGLSHFKKRIAAKRGDLRSQQAAVLKFIFLSVPLTLILIGSIAAAFHFISAAAGWPIDFGLVAIVLASSFVIGLGTSMLVAARSPGGPPPIAS